jgi:hypothetical protein
MAAVPTRTLNAGKRRRPPLPQAQTPRTAISGQITCQDKSDNSLVNDRDFPPELCTVMLPLHAERN